MKATAEHGSQGYLSYYADDAVEVPDGAPILQGKESIARTTGFLDNKQNHLTWTPVGAGISTSGDLGYTYGNCEFRSTGKGGKPVVAYGKYNTIWRKQRDGAWKVVLDMGNSSRNRKRRTRRGGKTLPWNHSNAQLVEGKADEVAESSRAENLGGIDMRTNNIDERVCGDQQAEEGGTKANQRCPF